jgi:hypothetical protein
MILFSTTGDAMFLYDDELQVLLSMGEASIERASHVEPEGLQWVADMCPIGGPKSKPFATRDEALQWERDWVWSNHFERAGNNGKL